MCPRYPSTEQLGLGNAGAGLAQGTELGFSAGMDFTAVTPVPLWDTRSQPQKVPCPRTATLAHV